MLDPMRRPTFIVEWPRVRDAALLAAALLFVLIACAGCVGAAPAHAEDPRTAILMEDGTIICTGERSTESLAFDLHRSSGRELVQVTYGWQPSFVASEHVAALVEVSRCPDNALVLR